MCKNKTYVYEINFLTPIFAILEIVKKILK